MLSNPIGLLYYWRENNDLSVLLKRTFFSRSKACDVDMQVDFYIIKHQVRRGKRDFFSLPCGLESRLLNCNILVFPPSRSWLDTFFPAYNYIATQLHRQREALLSLASQRLYDVQNGFVWYFV